MEIGADEGFNTRRILSYGQKTGARVHVIDPHPKFDPSELKAHFGDIFYFYKMLSLECLHLIEEMDVVIIDGDHNWYTVYNELKLIERNTHSRHAGLPIVFLHDIAWPYGRRDLYYNPENIPAAGRNSYARKGLAPANPELKEHGGFNPHLFHSVQENGPKNGVLTAVEDFMEEAGGRLELVKLPAFHGLGILFNRTLFQNTDFSAFIEGMSFSQVGCRLLETIESSRVEALTALAEKRQQFIRLETDKRRQAEEFRAKEKSLAEHSKYQERLLKSLEETAERLSQQVNELEETRKKEKEANVRKNEQFAAPLRQIRVQFDRLMDSRRWKMGDGLVRMLDFVRLKKGFRMASDHISRLLIEFELFHDADGGWGMLDAPDSLSDEALRFVVDQKALFPAGKEDESHSGGIDFVFFWKQNDTGIYGRRIDMWLKYLARRKEIRKIVVFDMPISTGELRSKANHQPNTHERMIFRETLLKNWGARNTEKISFLTFVYKKKTGERKRSWRLPHKEEYLEFIRDRLRDIGVHEEETVFWFYPANRYIPEIVKRFQPCVRIVDLVDDHRTWPGLSGARRLWLTRHYRQALAMADIAITNCRNMQKNMGGLHRDMAIIPNACDLDPAPDLSDDSELGKLIGIPHPRIGYVGNLEQAKIDVELIAYIADTHPEWQVVLIGSTHASQSLTELTRHENIHFLGVVPYPEIKAWIKKFDVAIIPHLDSRQTRSMNPLKLYVFCALNVPVVTTNIENIDEFRLFVSVADSHADFVTCIENALESPKNKISREMQLCLEENTWDKRVEPILEMLAGQMPSLQSMPK